MIYKEKEQAQLECDLLNRKHEGRSWEPVKIKTAGWRDTVPTDYWQPQEIETPRTQDDMIARHARRTMYVRS